MWAGTWAETWAKARLYAWLGWKVAKVSCRVWTRRLARGLARALEWSSTAAVHSAKVTNAQAYASRDWSSPRGEWCDDTWETVALDGDDGEWPPESMPHIPADFNVDVLTRLAREGASWSVLRRALPAGATAANVEYRLAGADYVACLTVGDALRLGRDSCEISRGVLRASLVLEDGTTKDVTREIAARYGPAGDWHGARETRRLFLPGTRALALELTLRDGRTWELPMSAPLPDTRDTRGESSEDE